MTSRASTREPLMDSVALCEYLGWTQGGLYTRRYRGTAPPAIKTGARQLRWRPRDVDRWLNDHQEPA